MQEKKTYTFEEAYEATLNYFDGDALAARVWVSKYAMKDGMGHIYEQTPTDMHWRIAHEIARIETNYPHPPHGRGGIRPSRPLPIYHSRGQPDDGHRQ